MKKGDIIIIVLLALVVVVGSVYTFMQGASSLSRTVVITRDQEVLYEIKINKAYERIINVEHEGHYNIVHIKDGEVWIDSANCYNQVCVFERPISKPGQAIVCLPHKLVIEIKGEKNQGVDIISE